jgi:MSHA biogenesis protein MshN
MSVINQVLNELENRGGSVPLGEEAIRAVPPRRQSHLFGYLIVGAAVLLLLAAITWPLWQAPAPAPKTTVLATLPGSASSPAASAPVAIALAPSAVAAATSGPPESLRPSGGQAHALAAKKGAVSPPVPTGKIVKHRSRRSGSAPDADAVISPLKTISPQQRMENEYRRANLALQEGRVDEALTRYRNALLIDPNYKDARRAWVSLLVRLKRNDEAESVLHKGLRHDPHDVMFAMQLARLQVARDDVALALATLQRVANDAQGQAEYHAFVAALFQRQGRHEEAVAHYQSALKLASGNGIWLMGMGISLQALHRTEEARTAYRQALASNSLNPRLQAFVRNKLTESDVSAPAAASAPLPTR